MSNFERNYQQIQADYQVNEIDFFKTDWQNILAPDLLGIDLIICADVIYNEEITRAFFKTLEYLITKTKEDLTIIISLEKRLWTDANGEIITPSYQVFLECLQEFKTSHSDAQIEEIELNFPHIFYQFYDRVNNLVIWQIKTAYA